MKTNINTESTRVHVAMYEPRISIIQEVVANFYGIPVEQTKTHNRKGTSIKARQRVHYFTRQLLPKCPLHVVGLLTGNGEAFDHSTVLHGNRSVLKELTFKTKGGTLVYPDVLAEVTLLRDEILKRFEYAKRKSGGRKSAKEIRRRLHVKLLYRKSRKFSHQIIKNYENISLYR